jgi:plastocyanin
VITILGKDNFYEPKDVAILVGVEYEFIFRNVGISVHNLVIESQAAGGRVISSDIVVDAGAESRFKVRIDTEGTYRMQCTYHPEMTGQVRVVRELPR